ncbi:MAG: RNA polymerase sigma factor [Vulcanimicrobiaceae bacterium]
MEGAYRAFGTSLYSVVRHVLGNDHDALLRLWQRAGSYRPERGPRRFLQACVRDEALTRKRNAARHFQIEERAPKSERREYEIEVSDHVESDRLRRALAKLPTEQRTALELAYFGHLSEAQIAERLDIPLGTVKSRLAMALRKLHAAMAANGGTIR